MTSSASRVGWFRCFAASAADIDAAAVADADAAELLYWMCSFLQFRLNIHFFKRIFLLYLQQGRDTDPSCVVYCI